MVKDYFCIYLASTVAYGLSGMRINKKPRAFASTGSEWMVEA